MRCDIPNCPCTRDFSDKELAVHKQHFHRLHMQDNQQGRGVVSGVCPECGSTMFYQEGCKTCPSCGYSKCG